MEIDLLLGWDCDSSRLWRSKTSVLYPISTGKSWSSLGFCIFLVIQDSVKPAPCPVMLRSCSLQARKGIETERGGALLGNPLEGSTQLLLGHSIPRDLRVLRELQVIRHPAHFGRVPWHQGDLAQHPALAGPSPGCCTAPPPTCAAASTAPRSALPCVVSAQRAKNGSCSHGNKGRAISLLISLGCNYSYVVGLGSL